MKPAVTGKNPARRVAVNSVEEDKNIKCRLCDFAHRTTECKKNPTPTKHKQHVMELKLCFSCLSPSHLITECKSEQTCYHYKSRHNMAICPKKYRDNGKSTSDATHSSGATSAQPVNHKMGGNIENPSPTLSTHTVKTNAHKEQASTLTSASATAPPITLRM